AAVAGLMWLYKGKDWLIRDAIISATEKATGVSVHLGSIRVELTKGDGQLKDFRLGNPKGFSREELLAVGKGTVDLELKSVTGPVIRIQKVDLNDVSILFEGSGKRNNMTALKAQVNERSSRPEKGKETKEKKMRIDTLVMNNVKLDVRMSGIVKVGKLDLGTIRMTNLGGTSGAPPADIAAAISTEITSRATTAVMRNMAELAGQMGQDVTNLAEGFGVPVPGVVEEAAGFFQNLFK
ncbi:MAG: hypothetical protein EBZ05_08160, partial [Verrucomicrobia bacterium]|nr:hypothetical protein [Verrucomicrobiota bacterium]